MFAASRTTVGPTSAAATTNYSSLKADFASIALREQTPSNRDGDLPRELLAHFAAALRFDLFGLFGRRQLELFLGPG